MGKKEWKAEKVWMNEKVEMNSIFNAEKMGGPAKVISILKIDLCYIVMAGEEGGRHTPNTQVYVHTISL